MAIGWMTVLKLVPWGEVIKNAPAVADGARKLWDNVGQRPPPPAATPPGSALRAGTEPQLESRLAAAEAEVATLQSQMQASSKLIKALAEQNTELIARVETLRARSLWLAAALAVFAAIAALNLAVTLSR